MHIVNYNLRSKSRKFRNILKRTCKVKSFVFYVLNLIMTDESTTQTIHVQCQFRIVHLGGYRYLRLAQVITKFKHSCLMLFRELTLFHFQFGC